MKKTSELLQTLKQNIEKENEYIKKLYQQELESLKNDLTNEWQEMQKQILKNTEQQNSKVLKKIEQDLANIDWELEQCRTKKKWIWAIGGMLAGIIATLLILKWTTTSYQVNYDGKITVTAYSWKWQIPKK